VVFRIWHSVCYPNGKNALRVQDIARTTEAITRQHWNLFRQAIGTPGSSAVFVRKEIPLMQNSVFDNTIQLLTTTLDYAVRRHEVIATNFANVETPNYKAKDLPFQSVLAAAMYRAEGRPTEDPRFAKPKLLMDITGEVRSDGNNVNAENEMLKLSKNSGLFNAAAEMMKYKFNTLKQAMSPAR
jgi:flagellar basal-body rod protein FlgB